MVYFNVFVLILFTRYEWFIPVMLAFLVVEAMMLRCYFTKMSFYINAKVALV